MDIETSSAIKLFFPNPSLVLVYFEAIANALDAGATEVEIDIEIQSYNAPETLKITVKDNGSGFTEENFDRFKTLLKPKDGFHKGIGRLVFLNYFENVKVSSKWEDNHRIFDFKDGFNGNVPIKKLTSKVENSTSLTFNKFTKDKVKSYDDLKPYILKERIIEHFLPTLNQLHNQGIDFKIIIDLSTHEDNIQKEFFSSEVVITPSDLPEMTLIEIKDNSIDAFSKVEMYYWLKRDTGRHSLLSAVSIDGRTIPVNLIKPGSIPADYSAVFIFSSEMFHASADSSRQKLVLPESVQESVIYAVLRREIGKVLAKEIPQISESNVQAKEQFEELFPHLLGYFEEATVGLIDRDEAINVAQQRLFQIQKEILQCEKMSDSIYEKSLDMTSRALTEYVLYRDKIIQRMKDMSCENSEADIHNLIVPRYNNYSQDTMPYDVYQNNAWLLDDKFMTFRTILSEARMDDVISSIRLDEEIADESGRPDIAMIFSADPDDEVPVDVVIVEIKKKTDDEKENQYAINQLLDRAVKLTQHCHNIQRIWYYAIIQINDTFATRLRQQKWAQLFSKGKVFYQEFPTERLDRSIVPTPIIVMSFDAIVSDAECRNHTFLEILRQNMRRHSEKLQNN